MEEKIAELVQGPNVFYAVKMTGNFRYVDTRVVPKQQRPYPPLIEAVKEQPTYHLNILRVRLLVFGHPLILAVLAFLVIMCILLMICVKLAVMYLIMKCLKER